jgi:hypothetical protein
VAQAFFKYGGSSLIKKLPNAAEFISRGIDPEDDEDEDDDDEDDQQLIDDSSERNSAPLPSKWDDTSLLLGRRNLCRGEKSFQKFVREVIGKKFLHP